MCGWFFRLSLLRFVAMTFHSQLLKAAQYRESTLLCHFPAKLWKKIESPFVVYHPKASFLVIFIAHHHPQLFDGFNDIPVARPSFGNDHGTPRHNPLRCGILVIVHQQHSFQHVKATQRTLHGEGPGRTRPNSHLGGSHVVQSGRRRTGCGVIQGVSSNALLFQVLRCELMIMRDQYTNRIAILFDLQMIHDKPHLVNGFHDIPPTGPTLGQEDRITGAKKVAGAVHVGETTVSRQDKKDFRRGSRIGRGPSSFGAPPRSRSQHAHLRQFARRVVRFADIGVVPGTLGGEFGNVKVRPWGVRQGGRDCGTLVFGGRLGLGCDTISNTVASDRHVSIIYAVGWSFHYGCRSAIQRTQIVAKSRFGNHGCPRAMLSLLLSSSQWNQGQ
mmetsp:Transcript_12823/g.28889  ORF Transcript_12823/g.28889 Transcript_12823/m.28889 type:complete len:386 (+) Transcript_12823:129-1286(+)